MTTKSIPIPKRIQNHPAEIYNQWQDILREVSRYQHQTGKITTSDPLVRMVCSWLDSAIGRQNRLDFLTQAFRHPVTSSKDLNENEKFGLVLWCNPWKDEIPEGIIPQDKPHWHGGEHWAKDLEILRKHYGQSSMMLDALPYETTKS